MVNGVTADCWTPDIWSFTAVMDMQVGLDPVRMTRYADDWHREVDRLAEVLVDLNLQIAAHVEETWRGDGADASVDALRRYVDGSLAGLAACRSVARRLSELSTAAGDLRAASGGFAPDALDDVLAEVRRRYSGPAVAAGNSVDDIPAPPDVFAEPGGGPAGALPVVASQPEQPQASPPPSTPSVSTPPVPGVSSATSPAGFTSATDQGLPSHTPGPPWHTPSAPSHTSTHSTALPERMPVSLDSPAPTPVPPVSAATAGASGQPGGVVPRTTAPSFAPYFPGMYPGHAGGRDAGGQHRTPTYLVSAGNAGELIGELPLVAPPVIGE
ncbi:MAG: hypothetical protein QOH57_881 [Mycobacterium sp.]|nr:hypothetical protein [Mycobacterium sp.]